MNKSIFSNVKLIEKTFLDNIMEKYSKSQSDNKLNLSIGMIMDGKNNLVEFDSVKKADQIILGQNLNKEYPPLIGTPSFRETMVNHFLGKSHKAVTENRVFCVQTPTGGAALRVATELLYEKIKKIYVSNVTFPMYYKLFEKMEVVTYPYYNKETKTFDFDNFLNFVSNVEDGSLINLQLSSHAPTGLDLTKDEWDQLLEIFKQKNHVAFFDIAYLGYATGDVQEELYPIHRFAEENVESIIAYSSGKNYTNYCDDVGALLFVLRDPAYIEDLTTNIIIIHRSIFSFPNIYGPRVVETIFNNEDLNKLWKQEQLDVYERIKENRKYLIDLIIEKKLDIMPIETLQRQRGVYAFFDLTNEEVLRLAEEHELYLSEGGRVNMTNLNKESAERLVNALVELVQKNRN